MSETTFNEDGQAPLSPSSSILDTLADSHVDSSDDELEIVLVPAIPQVAVSLGVSAPATASPPIAASAPVAAGALGPAFVNVRYTQVPLWPMVVDINSTHPSPWYTVIAGRFIGVFEDTGAADKATRKVSCSSHKAHNSQQAAVTAFNVAMTVGDLEVIT